MLRLRACRRPAASRSTCWLAPPGDLAAHEGAAGVAPTGCPRPALLPATAVSSGGGASPELPCSPTIRVTSATASTTRGMTRSLFRVAPPPPRRRPRPGSGRDRRRQPSGPAAGGRAAAARGPPGPDRLRRLPTRAPAQDLVDEPARAAQPRGQAPHRRRRHLPQRLRPAAPGQLRAHRGPRRMAGQRPPLPLRGIYNPALHEHTLAFDNQPNNSTRHDQDC
jgi:hypothetical protein